MPWFKSALSQACYMLRALAMDLLSWLQLLAPVGRLAGAGPAAVRTGLSGVPDRLAGQARRRGLQPCPAWPASRPVVTVRDRIQTPGPG
ncbi:hypothetical protein [Streptomyces sp. NPDC096030]|uniref:hypothetical protein n=1 Tax=Streptomyces sp. NPDC096030 TaxID=3155423 RepID=UPI0033319286